MTLTIYTYPWLTTDARQLLDEYETMKIALEYIAIGSGAFSQDPLTHAENTIDNMKAAAKNALAQVNI